MQRVGRRHAGAGGSPGARAAPLLRWLPANGDQRAGASRSPGGAVCRPRHKPARSGALRRAVRRASRTPPAQLAYSSARRSKRVAAPSAEGAESVMPGRLAPASPPGCRSGPGPWPAATMVGSSGITLTREVHRAVDQPEPDHDLGQARPERRATLRRQRSALRQAPTGAHTEASATARPASALIVEARRFRPRPRDQPSAGRRRCPAGTSAGRCLTQYATGKAKSSPRQWRAAQPMRPPLRLSIVPRVRAGHDLAGHRRAVRPSMLAPTHPPKEPCRTASTSSRLAVRAHDRTGRDRIVPGHRRHGGWVPESSARQPAS